MFYIPKFRLVILAAICGYIALSWSNAPLMAATSNQIQQIVTEEAQRHGGVPIPLALAVARVESNFRGNALSKAGARGVMQIMPKTALDEFGVNESDLWEPRLNVRLGVAYLSQLYKQYGNRWELALSHYNGGTLQGRGANARPHTYTRKYVDSVFRWAAMYEHRRTKFELAKRKAPSLPRNRPIIRRVADAYWSDPTPAIEKDWRYYLNISSRLLRSERSHSGIKPDIDEDWKMSTVKNYDDRPSAWQSVRMQNLSLNFRRLLKKEQRLQRSMEWKHFGRFM
jgi:hypothetical protein